MKKLSIPTTKSLFLWLAPLLALVFLDSCRKESLEIDNSYSSVSYLKMADAKRIAESISSLDVPKNNDANARVTTKRNVSKTDVIRKDKEPLIYIFNYDGGGFLILSASEKYYPVLAKSNVNAVNLDNAPPQFLDWLDFTKNKIDDVNKSPKDFEDKERVDVSWTNLKQEAQLLNLRNGKVGADCVGSITVPILVGPLMNTAWGQGDATPANPNGCGYNNLTPNVQNGCGPCNRALTGCVATVMAQVMRFWSHPNNYNWGAMNNNPPGTAPLMRDIGVAVNMNYGCNSSATTYQAANTAFRNTFQYPSTLFSNFYNRNTVVAELNQNRPVLLAGLRNGQNVGHAWVCDGYRVERECNYDTYYMNMNWGWDGESNGAYHDSNFLGYNFNRQMITNIRP